MAKARDNFLERGFRLKLREYLVRNNISFRYRKNDRGLIGTPDIYFPKLKLVIFIHGCFWHGHGCKYEYSKDTHKGKNWEKRQQNQRERDQDICRELTTLNYEVQIIWECDINKDPNKKVRDLINVINILSG